MGRLYWQFVLLGSFVLLGCETSRPIHPSGAEPCREQTLAQIVDVRDGDTVEVQYLEGAQTGTRLDIRLIGIDTPEVDHYGDDHDCYAVPAWRELIELGDGQEVWMTFDAECTDHYDRGLAYLFRASDGLFLNRHQIEGGFAQACPFSPNTTFADDFEALEIEAQAAGVGRWDEPCLGGPECFGGGS